MGTRPHEKQFGQLLTKAIRTIATYEDKNISVIQDEIGHSLRKKNGESYNGGAILEYWRKGHLPPDRDTILALTKVLAERRGLNEQECEKFLQAAGERGADEFYTTLFSLSVTPVPQTETTETSMAPPPVEDAAVPANTISLNIDWNQKTITLIMAALILFGIAAYLWSKRMTISVPPSTPAAIYTLSAIYTDQAPEIDGHLDEQGWMKAIPLVFAKHPSQNGATTVSIKLLWDNQYLYAGFESTDTQVEGSSVTPWDGDSVSFIVDSDYVENKPGPVEYRHSLIGVAEADRKGDLFSKHYLKDGTTYNDTTNEDTGFSVEMKIPWLTPPPVGTLLRIDLLSVDHDYNPDKKFDDPKTVFSKVFWDNDNTVDKGEGYLILVDK